MREVIPIKNLPNLITLTRIIAACCLLLTTPFSIPFFTLYFVCGLSDVLDGYLARKRQLTSTLGQILDSCADLIFISFVLLLCLPVLKLWWGLILWILAIAAIRLLSLTVGYIRYHHCAFLHTYANKATGLSLFFFPVLFTFWDQGRVTSTICALATVAALEELVINLTSKTLRRDRPSIFSK